MGTVRSSVRISILFGILIMANADGVRGVSGRNCSAVCCVPPRDFGVVSEGRRSVAAVGVGRIQATVTIAD